MQATCKFICYSEALKLWDVGLLVKLETTTNPLGLLLKAELLEAAPKAEAMEGPGVGVGKRNLSTLYNTKRRPSSREMHQIEKQAPPRSVKGQRCFSCSKKNANYMSI